MKKIMAFSLAILMLCLCGCRAAEVSDGTPPESLTERLSREMDGALEEELKDPDNSTTAGMAAVTRKYAEQWREIADEYYQKLLAYDGDPLDADYGSADTLHACISEMKTNWEQYCQAEGESYTEALQAICRGGSITIPTTAFYQYEMQKDWALKLIGIYLMLDPADDSLPECTSP